MLMTMMVTTAMVIMILEDVDADNRMLMHMMMTDADNLKTV